MAFFVESTSSRNSGSQTGAQTGSHFWGPIMPFLLEQKLHLLTQLVVVFKSKQNLAQLCSAASAGVPFKLKVVSGTRGNM